MAEQLKFDVFISYRRDGGEVMGRLLYELLKTDYNVFFDHESLSAGLFDKKLLEVIRECNDVLVILSEGCFDRCCNDGDWLVQEVNCAIRNNKRIIPLMMDGFIMPSAEEMLQYPECIQKLIKYNGYSISVAHMDSTLNKLYQHMLTPKKERVSLVDNVSEWGEFARCLSNPQYTRLLPEELKAKILHGAIDSFLDEWNGKILTSVLDKTLAQACSIRTKFRYEVEIDETFDFRGISIDEDKYYELSESLSYSKKFIKSSPDKSFWLSFATNLDELDSSLRNENFFFSENLLMDREDIRILCALSDEDKKNFYVSTMHTKININGAVLAPIKIMIDESGIFAKYELTDEVLQSSDVFDVKIKFRIPQRDGDGYFFASISEPTYNPFIRFCYPEESYDIKMIPFLNRSVTAKDTKIFEGVRELSVENEWINPVSGAIFIIKKMPAGL